jgi:hypothetical protein
MAIYVDHTHLGRRVTGLERITIELFSAAALAPLDIIPVTARGTRQMVTTQTLGLPMRLAATSSILLCPGFPPSPLLRPFASRVLPYIHDDSEGPVLYGGALQACTASLPSLSDKF